MSSRRIRTTPRLPRCSDRRAQQFIENSPFGAHAADNNRPFFNQYFRWAAVPQWMSTMGMGWLPFVEWGYILHVATLVVVDDARRAAADHAVRRNARTPESAYRRRSSSRSASPTCSCRSGQSISSRNSSLIRCSRPRWSLSAMLAASGAGAVILTRGEQRSRREPLRSFVRRSQLPRLLFPILLRVLLPATDRVRVSVSRFSGSRCPRSSWAFRFPIRSADLARETDIPWALALNGFGSVLGSLLATLVAVHFGLLALAVARDRCSMPPSRC